MNRIIFLLIVAFVALAVATLSPSSRKSKQTAKEVEYKIKSGPQPLSVFDRNLIEEEPSAKQIIVENEAYYEATSLRRFNGTVLAFITPWNSHGYDLAKTFGAKFDLISPVWLQILRKGELTYELTGTHDVDTAWMKNARKAGNDKTKILPRVIFDKFDGPDYTSLLSQANEREAVAKLIIESCKKYNFEGIVLEVWVGFAKRMEEFFINLVKDISKQMKQSNLELILVIPPPRDTAPDLFTSQHFDELYPFVSAFSLMTYDFSSLERPGANAPLHWMRHAIESICPRQNHRRKKILLGLNMYGYDYTPSGGGAIIGRDYLNLLREFKGRLSHDEHDRETFFELKQKTKGRHIVFYPSLYSINERIKLAMEMDTGISIWELGQGLDYFYDLF